MIRGIQSMSQSIIDMDVTGIVNQKSPDSYNMLIIKDFTVTR